LSGRNPQRGGKPAQTIGDTAVVITAKFASTCPNCQAAIVVGDRVEWNKGEKARHTTCQRIVDKSECEHPVFHKCGCRCAVPVSQPAPARIAVEDAGVYVLPDGSIVKVQANREKTRTYAKRWVSILGNRLTLASTVEHGEYRYVIGLVEQVAEHGRKMTLDEAKQFIILYGQCCRCGRKLKDAKSVEFGIGPVCIKYFAVGTSALDVMGVGAADKNTLDCITAAADSEFNGFFGVPAQTFGRERDDEARMRANEFAEQPITLNRRSRWSRASDDELNPRTAW